MRQEDKKYGCGEVLLILTIVGLIIVGMLTHTIS